MYDEQSYEAEICWVRREKNREANISHNEQALAKLWNLLFFRPVLLQVKGTEFYWQRKVNI